MTATLSSDIDSIHRWVEAFASWLQDQVQDEVQHVETHISHVFLTPQRAYKAKKPLKLSFLDFRALETRRYYTEQELTLNRRLAPKMYRAVRPVYQSAPGVFAWEPPTPQAGVFDYVLEMLRMDEDYRMDKWLRRHPLENRHLDQLAKTIAQFHQNAEPVSRIAQNALAGQYRDLQTVGDWLSEHLGEMQIESMSKMLEQAEHWLSAHQALLEQRNTQGWVRDVHGDLHTKNIFLYDPPVIFDCIEFNADFRQIDVLNDIAFLCMDLEAMGLSENSRWLWQDYQERMGFHEDDQLHQLFLFYKSYRANVRLKVTALAAQEQAEAPDQPTLDALSNYWRLMQAYWEELS
jgi:aminoglycoside phosphotransferase family enzyme